MENWNNLNKFLTLERKDFSKKELESQKLVEICSSNPENYKEIKNLLINGASLNCFADFSTPLISAIQTDNIELGKFLINMGATITFKPVDLEENAFWQALKMKKHDFLQLFVEKKCLLQRDYTNKMPALIHATIERDVKSVEILLKHYNINIQEKYGNGSTALHYNVAQDPQTEEDSEIGKMLIAAGADIQSVDLAGKTPQDMATDINARSMLLYAKLDRDVPMKDEDNEPTITPDDDNMPVVKKTNKNKMKI